MELSIVAVYTICDDLLISHGYYSNPKAKVSDAEVMTTDIVAADYFGGSHQRASSIMRFFYTETTWVNTHMLGHSRYIRRLHRISDMLQ